MLRYYIEYPRGFANEYEVFAVESGEDARFCSLVPEAERITRARAIHLGWTRPRQARKDGEQWFGGFRLEEEYPDTIEDTIAECVSATREMMLTMESLPA